QLLAQALGTRTETVVTDIHARTMRFLVPVPAAGHARQEALLDVAIDITQPLAALGHQIWFSALFAVGLVAVFVLFLYFLIRRTVVRPVTRLAAQAQKLGAGDLSVRSGLDPRSAGSQELHQLAVAFDTMAERMQRSEEDLEERARERTRELEIAVAELEAFSYAVSHDLRSPLRSIDGFALILGESLGANLTEQTRGYLDRVREQAQYMGSLIDNLLTLAHVSRAELERGRVDLSALASECVANLRRGDPARSIEVSLQGSMQANADPELLRVALAHLLENAWKFTRDTAHPRIEIGVEQKHNRAAAFVRDNGVGFDPAYVERLFTPFRRLHSPLEFGGTGIGLAIVQRVIQRHGGQIWAESAPGAGATFYFTLAGTEERA
ncbi:MAG TPA: ATP-binding protein, partial [Steroidobacteraceae bacterium]|nr:ATP-binding protein [Steroidobacteraceae bacterium]